MAKKPEEESFLDAVRGLKSREPFTPFRVVMTSGESYTIENPELLAMNEHHLVYCVPHTSRVIYMRRNQLASVDDPGEATSKRQRSRRSA